MAEKLDREKLMELGNRLIRTQYAMDADRFKMVFSVVSMPDYVILVKLSHRMNLHEPETKVYLKDISAELSISIQRVSKMVQNLQNKGYVYWKHDEDGSAGTYIYLSETGEEMMARQQEILHRYFANIVERLGYERFVEILDRMDRLETVMEEEAIKLQDAETQAA